ncbi:MAG: phage major tail tube protein, partial [Candidatus Cloacimonetes bacterium]|nr:phage major tail tube protein [Candidatus Cloacimonadota bacterium]
NFRVFKDGADQLGISDIELPSLEYMTETISGAGVSGEIDAPVMGQFASMGVTLNWRTVTKSQLQLLAPGAHHLDCRGAIQLHDAGSGEMRPAACKVVIRGRTKTAELGKFEAATTMDASSELEVEYLKLTLDGETVIELDKLNYICNIGGTDYMAGIRAALGLA